MFPECDTNRILYQALFLQGTICVVVVYTIMFCHVAYTPDISRAAGRHNPHGNT